MPPPKQQQNKRTSEYRVNQKSLTNFSWFLVLNVQNYCLLFNYFTHGICFILRFTRNRHHLSLFNMGEMLILTHIRNWVMPTLDISVLVNSHSQLVKLIFMWKEKIVEDQPQTYASFCPLEYFLTEPSMILLFYLSSKRLTIYLLV